MARLEGGRAGKSRSASRHDGAGDSHSTGAGAAIRPIAAGRPLTGRRGTAADREMAAAVSRGHLVIRPRIGGRQGARHAPYPGHPIRIRTRARMARTPRGPFPVTRHPFSVRSISMRLCSRMERRRWRMQPPGHKADSTCGLPMPRNLFRLSPRHRCGPVTMGMPAGMSSSNVERTREGMKAAKRRGHHVGRDRDLGARPLAIFDGRLDRPEPPLPRFAEPGHILPPDPSSSVRSSVVAASPSEAPRRRQPRRSFAWRDPSPGNHSFRLAVEPQPSPLGTLSDTVTRALPRPTHGGRASTPSRWQGS